VNIGDPRFQIPLHKLQLLVFLHTVQFMICHHKSRCPSSQEPPRKGSDAQYPRLCLDGGASNARIALGMYSQPNPSCHRCPMDDGEDPTVGGLGFSHAFSSLDWSGTAGQASQQHCSGSNILQPARWRIESTFSPEETLHPILQLQTVTSQLGSGFLFKSLLRYPEASLRLGITPPFHLLPNIPHGTNLLTGR